MNRLQKEKRISQGEDKSILGQVGWGIVYGIGLGLGFYIVNKVAKAAEMKSK